ncbi:hypothetical protein K438DRAFT_1793549 [Mycena galopus ATCC 62051]|nr:hypothetical protein K438DRAFT_1793549 [Mycena galopus ATCC 62051]
MAASEMVMDRRGGHDPRYWCLPTFCGDPTRVRGVSKARFKFHLVWQGHTVGTFDTWAAAKTSLTGYPGSANKGFHTLNECIEAWQMMCPLEPQRAPSPDPPSPQQQPRCVDPPTPRMRNEGKRKSAVKQEAETSPGSLGLLLLSPSGSDLALVSFAIRGTGIISSSPVRARNQYEQLQRQGEEPDMLVTRSFARASIFALDTEGETEDDDVPD